MMLGAVTIKPVTIGIPQKSKKFIDFSTASFKPAYEVRDSFEKMEYVMDDTTIIGIKLIVSNRRLAAPYQPTTALFVIRERRTVSIVV